MTCCVLYHSWMRFVAVGCSILLIIAGMASQFFSVRIVDFDYARDHQAVIQTFKADSYWLFAGISSDEVFDIDYELRTHSPGKNARYYGQLTIKVLHDHGAVAGFVTYYPLNSYEGQVQFLSVNHQFRGKGYGKLLLAYAVKQLFAMGCLRVVLTTRTTNTWAQRIYDSLGFKETGRDEGFVHYAIYREMLRA